MVFNCKGFYFDDKDEAFFKNSVEKRAEELPADEKNKKTRGSRVNRVVPVANAETLLRHQTEYDGAEDQSEKTIKSIDDLGGENSKSGSRRSRVAPEESFEEQNPQYFEQFHPQPPKGSHQSDDKKLKEKTENPSAEKFLDERVLLRILHCNCDSCRQVICKATRKFKDDRDANTMVDKISSKSRVKEKVKEKLGQQNSENSKLSLPQLKGNHGSDLMEPHQKIQNSGNQKTHKECSSPLLLRIRMHCNCDGCTKKMKDIFKRLKGVDSVKIHSDKDIVEVTGTMDTDKLVVYLQENLKRNVVVIPTKKDENGASPTQEDTTGVRHFANITDNASKKKEVYPDLQEKQNLEKTELTLPQPRKRDRNDNEIQVTGIVHLKIRMHCRDGCIPQTQKTAMEFTGVKSVEVDTSNHLVTVVGTINVKELVAYLKEKLNRSVEVVHVQNDNVAGDNKEVEVTNIETLKEPAAARADGRNNKDVEIKKEAKKEAKKIKIKKEVKDVKEEHKKYYLHDGGDGGTKEDKEDKKGKEGVEDTVKEAQGHGYISHIGEKHKELESEGDGRTYYQNYGKQDYHRYGLSNDEFVPVDHDCVIMMFSDENPNSCTIM